MTIRTWPRPSLALVLVLGWAAGCGEEPGSLEQDSKTCGLMGYPECTDCIKGEQGDILGSDKQPPVTPYPDAGAPFPGNDAGPMPPSAVGHCKSSPEWKAIVAAACSKRGLELVLFEVDSCCGPDSWSAVRYECCPRELPPPPPPPVCVKAGQGGPTSCKDTATWKLYASQDCAAQGMTLKDYGPYDPCGADSYRYVSYICCK